MAEPIRSTIQKRDAKGVVRHGGEWLALWADPESLRTASERREAAAQARRLSDLQRSIAASARAIAGDPDLVVDFGESTAKGEGGLTLNPVTLAPAAVAAARGEADAQASILRHHDAQAHARLAPDGALESRLFRLCEDARCAALAARAFPGVAANLAAHQYDRLSRADLAQAHLAALIPLGEALTMVLRDAFTGAADASIQSGGMRMWDQWLRARFGDHFRRMSEAAGEQSDFAAAARAFIARLLAELPSAGARDRRFVPTPGAEARGAEADVDAVSADRPLDGAGADFDAPGAEIVLDDDARPSLPAASVAAAAQPPPYAAFTTRYDRLVEADALVDPQTLRGLRLAIEDKRGAVRRDAARLVSRLQRKLIARQLRAWAFDREEGLIDASRLDRVIVNPDFAQAFKHEVESPFIDTAVTLLIDNSGSMRGRPIEIAYIAADLLAAALERCGVAFEVLGFTTTDWKGGGAKQDWLRAGRPQPAGRLNGLLHIIYKAADTPFRRARDLLPAMLSPGLLKENIDGEALDWAARRLARRPERRKILIVISDGAPADQATLEENADKTILDRHLRETIRSLESDSGVTLSAIGVRHDVRSHYQRAVEISRAEDLAATLTASLDALLTSA